MKMQILGFYRGDSNIDIISRTKFGELTHAQLLSAFFFLFSNQSKDSGHNFLKLEKMETWNISALLIMQRFGY